MSKNKAWGGAPIRRACNKVHKKRWDLLQLLLVSEGPFTKRVESHKKIQDHHLVY